MMAWSLANVIAAEAVNKLLDDADSIGTSAPERDMPREVAASVIHAALWAYGSRAGSTAGAYAMSNLMDALGIKRWSFKEDWSDNPDVAAMRAEIATASQQAAERMRERCADAVTEHFQFAVDADELVGVIRALPLEE